MRRELGRIRVRFAVVNLVVLLVPVAGLEFARVHERQLLASLQRDMRNQAALVRESLEANVSNGEALATPRLRRILTDAATTTRTRIRVLDQRGQVVLDSHEGGPPEGPEPPAPTLIPRSAYEHADALNPRNTLDPERIEGRSTRSLPEERWPTVPDRREVRSALRGQPDAYTRIRSREPAVFLFLAEPVRHAGGVVGVVYVTRSTRPVLAELYKIRRGLTKVLVLAVFVTLFLTLMLAWSISRPLSRLARAARRITRGERAVEVPVGGSGEILELSEALSSMTRQLDARMRYISEFAADVAHELKSPLTSIRGAAELLREGAADDPEARSRFLENIVLDAERLDRLVVRLLELSRIDSSQEPMEDFDLEALVNRVIERTHTPEQPVEADWRTPIRRWCGREEDLERALLNLVENAVRFSPPGVPVGITVHEGTEARELMLSVRDQGPGIPRAHRTKVFDRFFTTDADRHGTGLGLAIVASVARAHEGRVELESVEGEGSEFRLYVRRP